MCCASSHQCCATGNPDPDAARAEKYSTGKPFCSDLDRQNLLSRGFTNGTACAPADGACCADGHACESGHECCHSQCIPAGNVCCPPTSTGMFGYCLSGLTCGDNNEFCNERPTAAGQRVAASAAATALAVAVALGHAL